MSAPHAVFSNYDYTTPSPEQGWAAYVRNPAWAPHFYDARRDSLVFANLPRETQRKLTFLDPRFMGRAEESPEIPILELSESAIREEAGPLHFIFHTGFCCSTLLTRALDIPGVSMGLKEPSVLACFAEYFSNRRRSVGAPAALSITLDLLSRPLARNETQIVKPSTTANHIMPQLLHARHEAKAILLFSSLDTFLRAIARRGLDGRIFARQMFRQFAPINPLESGFCDEDAMLQADLQVAAQAWLMQTSFMDQLAQRFGRDRVRVLSSESLLNDPAGTLLEIGAFMNLALPPELAKAITEGSVFQEHAKELGRPFNAAAAKEQFNEAGRVHREELAMAKDWARALAIRCGAPLVLEETLRAKAV